VTPARRRERRTADRPRRRRARVARAPAREPKRALPSVAWLVGDSSWIRARPGTACRRERRQRTADAGAPTAPGNFVTPRSAAGGRGRVSRQETRVRATVRDSAPDPRRPGEERAERAARGSQRDEPDLNRDPALSRAQLARARAEARARVRSVAVRPRYEPDASRGSGPVSCRVLVRAAVGVAQ
jgi:hypothetical protein